MSFYEVLLSNRVIKIDGAFSTIFASITHWHLPSYKLWHSYNAIKYTTTDDDDGFTGKLRNKTTIGFYTKYIYVKSYKYNKCL